MRGSLLRNTLRLIVGVFACFILKIGISACPLIGNTYPLNKMPFSLVRYGEAKVDYAMHGAERAGCTKLFGEELRVVGRAYFSFQSLRYSMHCEGVLPPDQCARFKGATVSGATLENLVGNLQNDWIIPQTLEVEANCSAYLFSETWDQ